MADSDFGMGYALGADSGNGSGSSGSGGFGGGWGEGLWAIIILAMLGFGRGGFGGYGGGELSRGDLCDGFNFNNLENGVRGIQQGIADSTYALNNSIMSGFHGVDNAVCTLGYQNQQGFNTLGHQISDCCCETQRLIERGFCDTNANIAAQTRTIIDYLTNEKIDALRAENQTLKFQASQSNQNSYLAALSDAQTAELIRRIAPTPVPAYSVPAPYPYGYGYGNSCGCGGNF